MSLVYALLFAIEKKEWALILKIVAKTKKYLLKSNTLFKQGSYKRVTHQQRNLNSTLPTSFIFC